MKKKCLNIIHAPLFIILIVSAVVFIRTDSYAQDVPDTPRDEDIYRPGADADAVRSEDIYQPKPGGKARQEDPYHSGEDSLYGPEQKQTDIAIPGEVTVEQAKENEWKIINKYGDFVGTLKSDSKRIFQIYDTNGLHMGYTIESGVWFPRNYRSRYTKIVSREVFLYLDALDAIEKVKMTE